LHAVEISPQWSARPLLHVESILRRNERKKHPGGVSVQGVGMRPTHSVDHFVVCKARCLWHIGLGKKTHGLPGW
jgi:hypothetical protein